MNNNRLLRAIGGRVLSFLVATCFVGSAAIAQPQTDLAGLDRYFEQAQKDWGVPGIAVAIVKDNLVVFAKGYGVRELGSDERVDENTLFAIASNTKAFTAAGLAILVDEGALDWNDHVQTYLPYFQLYDPYVSYDMRVRDLLCHRSGLGTFSGDLLWYGTSYSSEEVLRRARYLPQAFPFRAGYGYSNLMFIAAGEVLEAVSGVEWSEFMRTHFFEPLGMTRTATSTTDLEDMDNVATPHGMFEGKLVTFPWYNWDNVVSAGGIISCVKDMAQWMRLQLNQGTFGESVIFSKQQSDAMWTPQVSYTVRHTPGESMNTHFRGYALGWGVHDYKGRKVLDHGGGYDGMFSQQALVPEENLGVIVLTNGMTSIANALVNRVLDTYLGGEERDWSAEMLDRRKRGMERDEERKKKDDESRIEGTSPSLPLQQYSGTYGGPMYGDATVSVEDGQLVVALKPNPDLVGDLSHWHYDTFVITWRQNFPWFGKGKVQFLLGENGNVVEMKMDIPNHDFWFTELEFKKKSGE